MGVEFISQTGKRREWVGYICQGPVLTIRIKGEVTQHVEPVSRFSDCDMNNEGSSP